MISHTLARSLLAANFASAKECALSHQPSACGDGYDKPLGLLTTLPDYASKLRLSTCPLTIHRLGRLSTILSHTLARSLIAANFASAQECALSHQPSACSDGYDKPLGLLTTLPFSS